MIPISETKKLCVSFAIAITIPVAILVAVWWRGSELNINTDVVDSYATFLPLIAIPLTLYFLPLIVAKTRNHRQTLAIGVLNFLAGWTLIGWVVALVWACIRPAPRDDSNGGGPFVERISKPSSPSNDFDISAALADLGTRRTT
jgi:hypothetical protein